MAKPEQEKTEETIGKKPEMEIKTMRKDLIRLRLLESEQEKDKIIDLQKHEKVREKDLERIEEFKEQKQVKEEKRMKKIWLFRGREKEKPALVKTEAKPPEIISEEPSLPSKPLISATPLSEFERPSAAPASPKPALALPSVPPKDENQNKLAPPELPTEPSRPLAPQPDKFSVSEKDRENQRKKLLEQRQNIVKALSLTVSEEKRIEQKIHLIEEEEAKSDLEDRQSIEKTRQYLEKQRNVIEQRRWQQEKQSQEVEQKIKDLDSKLAAVPAPDQDETVQPPKKKLDNIIEKEPTPVEQTSQALVSSDFAKAGQDKHAKSAATAILLPQPQEKPSELPIAEEFLGPKSTPEQRLAQAKQRLASFKERSEQAKKELETEEIDKFKEKLKQSAIPEKKIAEAAPDSKQMFEGGVKIYREMPAKQPESKKLFTRIAFILVILLGFGVLAGFIYWLFTNWQIISGTNELPIITDIVGKQKALAPEPIIAVENEMTLEIFEDNELPMILAESLNKELDQGQFTILNIKQGENFLGLDEFLRILEIKMPLEISEKLEPKFTLFMYSITESLAQALGSDRLEFVSPNRLGFVAKIKENEQIYESMRSWEQSMENDTENLFITLGKTQPASTSVFSEAKYKEKNFRYISFPQMDFGICWAITNDYLVFASSGEAMIETIDLIDS